MKVDGIHMSWITVSNLEKAIDYYTKVVGLNLLETSPEYGWAELGGPNGTRLGLAVANEEEGFKAGQNAVVCVTVDSLDSFKTEKKDSIQYLGEIQEVPGQVRMQLCRDADGNQFHIVENL